MKPENALAETTRTSAELVRQETIGSMNVLETVIKHVSVKPRT